MLEHLRHLFATAAVKVWLSTAADSVRSLPTPPWRGAATAAGADPHRILLFGSGVAVGYGVVTHELALGGHLARALSAITGRGAVVESITHRELRTRDAATMLADEELARFDAVVLSLGVYEASTLLPEHRWRDDLAAVLRPFAAPDAPAVVVMGVPQAPTATPNPTRMRRRIGWHGAAFNELTRRQVAELDGTFAEPPPSPGPLTGVGREPYARWGARLAPAVAASLGSSAPQRTLSWDEQRRGEAAERWGRRLRGIPDLERIARTARDLFGVSGASINVIDGDRQRTAAGCAIGTVRPREQGMCDLTVRSGRLTVVHDALHDPRWTGRTGRPGHTQRFYAGYPIESPEGLPIATLCVYDAQPRVFCDRDGVLLRELALQAQSAIWEHAEARAGAGRAGGRASRAGR